jgi:branched-chain amino acid transport system ATP-binding protein
MTELLRVAGLLRRFDGIVAVNDLDLAFNEGELVSIIGPNGAGKTTLFNLITGHDVPDAGRVVFDGRDVAGLAPERIAALGMARTFQHGRVFANMSVRDNVLVGAHTRLDLVRHMPRLIGPLTELILALVQPPSVVRQQAALDAEMCDILALFGDRLLPRLDDPAFSLSYANRRRIEIARALASRPRILLLDEPTAGMNPAETLELAEQIKSLNDLGLTVLLIEHKLDVVTRLADTVYVLDHGDVIASGKPDEVRKNEEVLRAYLGRNAQAAAAGVA